MCDLQEGMRFEETLTGFKWICNKKFDLQQEGFKVSQGVHTRSLILSRSAASFVKTLQYVPRTCVYTHISRSARTPHLANDLAHCQRLEELHRPRPEPFKRFVSVIDSGIVWIQQYSNDRWRGWLHRPVSVIDGDMVLIQK